MHIGRLTPRAASEDSLISAKIPASGVLTCD